MKLTIRIELSLVLTITALQGYAQGTLQNLDFESGNLSPLPMNQWGTGVEVPIASALPNWTGYVGSDQQTQVYQNSFGLGQAQIDVFGPNYTGAGLTGEEAAIPGTLDGGYSVLLQAGGQPGNSSVTVNASIEQMGTVPMGSQSIEFRAWQTASTSFTVSLGGNTLSPVALANGPNYTWYGVNIPSSFDGQSAQLEFTADFVTVGPSWLGLDDIAFSPQSIPEPSPIVLSGIAGILFALYRRIASKGR